LAYRKVKNFACIELFSKQIKVFLTLDPATVELKKDFTRDVSNVGHHGTGDVEVLIRSQEDLKQAKPLIERAYNEG
jgi:predicted transport protein